MKTREAIPGMPLEQAERLQAICDQLKQGIPFSKEVRDAAPERMDCIREENRRHFGTQDIGGDLVSEMRESR